jgi:hypothetical protein
MMKTRLFNEVVQSKQEKRKKVWFATVAQHRNGYLFYDSYRIYGLAIRSSIARALVWARS